MTVLDRAARRERWVPAPRPDWLAKVNAEGACFNLNEVVPLDARSLLDTAVAGTGLDDFGADGWREPFHILTKALDEESGLTLMGRLMTRAQLLVLLEARLRIEDTYKRHPEIDDEVITAPLMIVGQGRTGGTGGAACRGRSRGRRGDGDAVAVVRGHHGSERRDVVRVIVEVADEDDRRMTVQSPGGTG